MENLNKDKLMELINDLTKERNDTQSKITKKWKTNSKKE